jgi:hypothetical protein
MSAFGQMVDILFANPDLALDATCAPSGGSPAPCRVIARNPDADAPLGAAGLGLSPASQSVEAFGLRYAITLSVDAQLC